MKHDAPAASSATSLRAPDPAGSWRWALVITLAFAFLRLLAIRNSPLELYPDEAQYWLWSRHLDLGYSTKPPMIAWIIRLTTLGGDSEPFVRMASPLLHGAAGLCLYATGRRLYGAATGLLGLMIYTVAPAIQLGAFVITTDTPLAASLAASLLLYAAVQQVAGRARLAAAAGFGLALGLAFLSKYAALYALISVGLHLAWSRDARRAWTWPAAALAVLAFAVAAGPNIAWNVANSFTTVSHTAANAAWASGRHFRLESMGEFIGEQFGMFGPAPFAILLGAGAVLAWRRKLEAPDLLLLAWALPPLAIITVEAFISRAHANWAATSYLPASILVAAWLLRWGARRWAAAVVIGQAVVAVLFLVAVVRPDLVDAVGGANALKQVRGWRQLTSQLVQQGRAEGLAAPFTGAAADTRFLYDEAAYYGRSYFGQDGPTLRAWPADRLPSWAAVDRSNPLPAIEGGRVLLASLDGYNTASMMKSFGKAGDLMIVSVRLDAKHMRRMDIFVGERLLPPPPAVAAAPPAK